MFVCIHQPDGFKDLLTGDFCCRRLFILPGLGCCRGQVLGIKICFDLLGQLQPGLVLCVGVGVHQDSSRCVACIALHRLEVAIRLQELVGGTGMAQTVEHDTWELWVRILPFEELFPRAFTSVIKTVRHLSCCNIRFKQVEPPLSGAFVSPID